MKGLISHVEDTGINPKNTAKLEQDDKQGCEKITLDFCKYPPKCLVKVDT